MYTGLRAYGDHKSTDHHCASSLIRSLTLGHETAAGAATTHTDKSTANPPERNQSQQNQSEQKSGKKPLLSDIGYLCIPQLRIVLRCTPNSSAIAFWVYPFASISSAVLRLSSLPVPLAIPPFRPRAA